MIASASQQHFSLSTPHLSPLTSHIEITGLTQKLRYGTTFAFVSQVCLVSSVGFAYTQWLWKSLYHKDTKVSVNCLDAAFVADTSVLSILNTEMLWKLKLGSLLAVVAWLVYFDLVILGIFQSYLGLLCLVIFTLFSIELEWSSHEITTGYYETFILILVQDFTHWLFAYSWYTLRRTQY